MDPHSFFCGSGSSSFSECDPIQKLLQEGDSARLVPGVDRCVVAHYSLQSVDAVILRQHAVELHGMGDTGACVEDLMREILASQWT